MPETKIPSRRQFIQRTASIGGAAAMAMGTQAFATPTPPPAKWDNTADVVVAGGGAGGLVAASILAQKGMSVILLEKEPTTGGSSAISGGAIALAGTDMQQARGIQDSTELLIKDLLEVGQHANDANLVKAYADHQLELYAWLKSIGAKFNNVTAASGQSVPRSHAVDAGEHLKLLRRTAISSGAKIRDMTPVHRLVYDESAGRVLGVLAKDRRNTDVSYSATKAVILATGGYARDAALLTLFTPAMKTAPAITGVGCTGDGLRMAWALGAGLADVAYVKATYGFRPGATTISDMSLIYYKGAIMVNQAGKRFVNESLSYKLLGDASAVQPGGYSYLIYDEPVRQAMLKDSQSLLGIEKTQGAVVKADSLAALSAMVDIKSDVLEDAIRQYNENVSRGMDPQFGRTTLSAGYGKPIEIKTAPFYAFKAVGVILGTYSGVTINTKAQVIDVYANVIPGLYAIGEVTGGFHGAAYMTGTALGKTQVFGLIAAKTVATGV
jgi:fumarate reductase flavoprotein subunit